MQRNRRSWHLLLVGLLLSLCGTASAQGFGLARTGGIEALYEYLREQFESARGPNDLGPRLLSDLYLGLGARTGTPVDEEDRFQVCVELVGTGTKPRLDGGGDLLTVLDRQEDRDRLTSGVPARGLPDGHTEFVVIDEFDLLALTVSLDLHRRLQPQSGLFTSNVLDDGDRSHWRPFYGFRLDVVDPRAPEATVVPHGHLVAFHALAHFGRAEIVDVILESERHAIVSLATQDDRTVRLHLLDVDFDDVATIREAVRTVPSLGGPHGPVPTFVIMSWGLVDCALADRYAAEGSTTPVGEFDNLADYLAAVFAASDGTAVATLLRGLCEAVEPIVAPIIGGGFTCTNASPAQLAEIGSIGVLAEMDVRAQEAVGWSGQPGGVRYFAAAGNQGFAFPMPPAAWPGVIGVEACSGTSMERDTRFSNRGTTTASVAQPAHRARGAYFASPEALDGAALVYWGTSFAAPSAAVHAATEPPRLDASGQAVAFPVDPEYANWCGL